MPLLTGGLALQPGRILFQEFTFTQTAVAAGTWDASMTVPANAFLIDIKITALVQWETIDAATMIVGDATDPDGWFTGIDVKADIDIVSGTNAEIADFQNAGGLEGAYLHASSGERAEAYSAAARVITGTITTTGAGTGTAGRTRMIVLYTNGPTDATVAAFTAT